MLDVEAALGVRGYAPWVAGELELAVEDPLLPENAGPWTVRVEGGRAAVQRGGAGRLVLSPGALAALFTGHLSARALADAGWARGAPADLTVAGALFAGPAPWFRDRF